MAGENKIQIETFQIFKSIQMGIKGIHHYFSVDLQCRQMKDCYLL